MYSDERQSNVGTGMIPHKKSCRCDECEVVRQQAEIQRLRALITAHNEKAEQECASPTCFQFYEVLENGQCEDCPRRYKIEVDNG